MVLDPPGDVFWLAAGRPQLVAERLREAVTGDVRAIPLRDGAPGTTPDAAVAAAVAAARTVIGPDRRDVPARLTLRLGPVDLARLVSGLHLGDSHGLAIAVAVLRADGSLGLPDDRIAATGRVGPDGRVGPVGGIAPKARAAARAGATLLLVPVGQEAEARRAVGPRPTTVVGVADLADLLAPRR